MLDEMHNSIFHKNLRRLLRFAILLPLLLVLFSACERERIVDPGPDTNPPLPPAGVIVESAHDGFVFVGWLHNNETDLRGYIVYRAESNPSGPYAAIDTLTQNYIIDEQRSYDTLYYYYVTAIDEDGNESGSQDTVSASSPNLHAPEYPSRLSVNGLNNGSAMMLRLSWTAVEEADLAGYHIYRSLLPFEKADSLLLIASTDAIFFDDIEASHSGVAYYYAVSAIDRGGRESALSAIESDFISHRPQLVYPIHNGKAQVFPLLKWLPVPEAAEYLISISLTEFAGEIWTGYVSVSSADTVSMRYAGSALIPGNTYYWRASTVTAANGRPNGISEARRFVVED
jgi:hypothetical protein